jgi:hypothetical protein
LLVLAFAFAAAAVAAIARLPSLAVAAVFAPTIGFGINLYYGEPVPLAIAALCASAYALERGAYRTAAALAVLASLEPHVALPAIVGLAVLAPRTRVALGLALLAGGALSLTALGSARTLEYVTTLLPIHAQAELLARDQFGLSRFLALAGVPARAALTLGGLSYLATMAYGVFAAGRLAATYERPAFVVLFPVAAAMLGGSFVHDVQIVAALPAAVLLAPYSRPARVALALLVVDWTQWWRSQLLPTFTGAAGAAALAFRSRPRSALRWLIGAPLLSLALLTALGRVPDREVGRASVQRAANAVAPPGAAVALRPNDSASRAWALRIALSPGWKEMSAHDIADKVPFWVALGLLLVAGTCRERGRDEA